MKKKDILPTLYKNTYKIFTYITTLISLYLIIWGCYQKPTPDRVDEENVYVIVLSINSAITCVRWLRIAFDDDIK